MNRKVNIHTFFENLENSTFLGCQRKI